MRRNKDESYQDYKTRRDKANKWLKRRLKGVVVWYGNMGTYIRDKHKHIIDEVYDKVIEKRKTE